MGLSPMRSLSGRLSAESGAVIFPEVKSRAITGRPAFFFLTYVLLQAWRCATLNLYLLRLDKAYRGAIRGFLHEFSHAINKAIIKIDDWIDVKTYYFIAEAKTHIVQTVIAIK